MKIKRYIGKDSQEAMVKVRMDMGSDAVILNTRKIRQKGFMKLFSKPLVEVLAAIDEDISRRPQKKDKPKQKKEIKNDLEIQALEDKMKNIEQMVKKIYTDVQPKSENSTSQSHAPTKGAISQEYIDKNKKMMQVIINNLQSNKVERSIIEEITQKAEQYISKDYQIDDIASKMYSILVSLLGKPQPIQLDTQDTGPKVITFVGPTGVGKTTTLAKIAAIFSINNNNNNIGFISADTYRIAAVEQLKTYAEILGLPVNVVYSPDEIPKAIEKFSDKDLILIDTAGRSHKDEEQFEELKKLIEYSNPHEIYLLISLTTDNNVGREIIKSYSFLKDYKIIFTKMDEAATPGIILNIKKMTDKNLSYVTTGQSVPDDIEIANNDEIAKKLLGSVRI